MSDLQPFTVLHYTGYDVGRGGIMTNIGHLAAAGSFRCVMGVNRGFRRSTGPNLDVMEFPQIDGERISPMNFLRARAVAQRVREWLRAGPRRIFHGHSRAGLLVALWLHCSGETGVVVSVHCYGRQCWFYRMAKRILGSRLLWLTPAMKRYYYDRESADWGDCVPNGLPGVPAPAMRRWKGDRPLRVGGAGQLTANKRWHLLLNALAKLPGDVVVEFRHAGGRTGDGASAAYAEELKAIVVRHGLQDRVCWLGWQSSSAGLLLEVDVVIVPFHCESFSLVALEALYAGVPVIAARGGGPDDLIQPGLNGWLVPPDDAAALARQLMELSVAGSWAGLRADPENLRRFGIATVAAQWTKVYTAL